MPDPVDEYGIPIRTKSKQQVDEYGIAIKKKENGFNGLGTTSVPSTSPLPVNDPFSFDRFIPQKLDNAQEAVLPPDTKSAQQFNEEFETLTGYKKFDLNEPLPATGLRGLLSDRDEKYEGKKAATYIKEKQKIDAAAQKIYFGNISSKELSDLQSNPYSRNIINNVIKEHVPNATDNIIESPEIIDIAAKRIKEKNRINAVNAEKGSINQLDGYATSVISELNTPTKEEAGTMTPIIDELRQEVSVSDFNNSDQISGAIQKIKEIEKLEQGYYLGYEAKESAKEKTQALLKIFNDRLFYNISRQGESESLSQLGDRISQVVISKVSDDKKAGGIDSEDNQSKINQFKLGLTALEKIDPISFKQVVNAIALERNIPDSDFSDIASIGQQIDNAARYRGGAYDPALIDSETNFDYGTKGQKVALASAQIGEWMNDKGHTNMPEFSEKLIKQAAKDLEIDNDDIINTIVFNEKLKGYDQIPKSGAVEDVIAGVMQPFQGIVSTINSLYESPAQTYLRSKSLQPDIGTQKVPDTFGNVSDILPSERGKFTTDMFRGLGQFLPQILLTKGVGAGLRGTAAGLTGGALSAKSAKNIADVGGTFVSTFLQSYGQSYEEHLKKTGDSDKAALIGTIDGVSAAAFEGFILPDVKIFDKAVAGLKGGLANNLADLVKKGGDPSDLMAKARPFLQKVLVNATNISGQEISEEVGTGYVDFVTETIFDPESAKDRNVYKELWDVTKSTFAAMSLPAILGGGGASFQRDFTTKSLHSAAINFDKNKESLQNSLDKEYISQDVFDKSIQILSTHKQSIDTAPEINSEGKKLTPQEKLDYAYESTKVKVYNDKLSKATTTPEKSMWEGKIKDAEKIQEGILIPKNTTDTKLSEPIEGLDEQRIPIGENVPKSTIEQAEILRSEEDILNIIKAPVPTGKLKRMEVQVKSIDPETNEVTLKPMKARDAIVEMKKQIGVIDMIKKCL